MELVAVVVILAVLAGVALPRLFDHSASARESADTASIGAIQTALQTQHVSNRVNDAPAGQWITAMSQVPSVMQNGDLPYGLVIDGTELEDQRGTTYTLVAETISTPARLVEGGGGGGGGGGGKGGGK